MQDSWTDQVAGIGALAEPARRALYRYVVTRPDAVGRQEAAEAVGVPLHSAKFHLDRLVEEGLLRVEFRRLTGRRGPGAGRPAKLYRRADRELSVSVPERRYDLAGAVLAAAIDEAVVEGTSVGEAVGAAAHERGRALAVESAARTSRRQRSPGATRSDSQAAAGVEGELERAAAVLDEIGFEPRLDAAGICLVNCPFDRLAAEHTELICGMNVELVGGVVVGLGCRHIAAALAPHEGTCCVRVGARAPRALSKTEG